MTIKHIALVGVAAIGLVTTGLVTTSSAIAQMGRQSSPAQATHGLPPSGDTRGDMRGGMNDRQGGDGPGLETTRSGHGQGDAMAMRDRRGARGHARCRMVRHHGRKVRRCM